MKLLLLSSYALSSMYFLSSHPVMLMGIILTQATLLCILIWFLMKSSWFSFILFLIFLGGLMVLFIYITSLASNELISINILTPPQMMFAVMFTMMFMTTMMNSQMSKYNIFLNFNKSFMSMFSNPSTILIALTMIYLLLTLIVVVKISDKFNGPIKSMIFAKN